MSWFKVDDRLCVHPKALEAGNAAMGAWVRLGSWCAGHLTDGWVSRAQARQFASARELRALVTCGLCGETDRGRDGGVGFQMHDFLDYNPRAQDVLKVRSARAKAGSRGGTSRAHRQAKVQAKVQAKLNPDPDPDPTATSPKQQPPFPPRQPASPEVAIFERAIRSHGVFPASLDALDLAEQLEGARMVSGKPVEWVVAAVAEAASKASADRAANEPWSGAKAARAIVGFARAARGKWAAEMAHELAKAAPLPDLAKLARRQARAAAAAAEAELVAGVGAAEMAERAAMVARACARGGR